MVKEDYTYGTGDNTVIIEKDEWLEVAGYDDVTQTYTLISSDVRDPLVYSDMPQKAVDKWDDVETHNWNKTFDFAS